jgi:hypothetical protein
MGKRYHSMQLNVLLGVCLPSPGLVLFVGAYNGIKMLASLLFTIVDFWATGMGDGRTREFRMVESEDAAGSMSMRTPQPQFSTPI